MSGRRKFSAARCSACGLHVPLCLCASMPRVVLDTQIVLVQNAHERNRPTNTGRLAHLMISNSVLLPYGQRGEPFDDSGLRSEEFDHRLVFHRECPQELVSPATIQSRDGRRPALVFLDGTWAQCSRMSRRIGALTDMPTLALPPGPGSPWRVRAETHAHRVSTLEAILRAVESVESREAARRMREWFYRVTAAMMYMKGMLREPQMPADWEALLEPDDQPPASSPAASKNSS